MVHCVDKLPASCHVVLAASMLEVEFVKLPPIPSGKRRPCKLDRLVPLTMPQLGWEKGVFWKKGSIF